MMCVCIVLGSIESVRVEIIDRYAQYDVCAKQYTNHEYYVRSSSLDYASESTPNARS